MHIQTIVSEKVCDGIREGSEDVLTLSQPIRGDEIAEGGFAVAQK